MDASPDVLADQVRSKRTAIDDDLERLRRRLTQVDARKQDAQRWAKTAIPIVAGTAAVWLWRRRRGAVDTLEDLLRVEVRDLYRIEEALLPALDRMGALATNPELQSAFEQHRRETEVHIERLERVCRSLHVRPKRGRAGAVDSVVAEVERLLERHAAPEVRDAGLIASAQRLEHLEIASYGSARTHANTLGFTYAAELLQQSLDEERTADEKLTNLAERFVTPQSVRTAWRG